MLSILFYTSSFKCTIVGFSGREREREMLKLAQWAYAVTGELKTLLSAGALVERLAPKIIDQRQLLFLSFVSGDVKSLLGRIFNGNVDCKYH